MLQKQLLQRFWAAKKMYQSAKNFVDFLQLQKSCERILPQIVLLKIPSAGPAD